MGKVKNFFTGNFARKTNTESYRGTGTVNDFGGTRTTVPKFSTRTLSSFSSLPRKARRQLHLDDRLMANMSIEDLMDALIDSHPDVSFALWNFLRIGNSGYKINVYNTDMKTRYPLGEKMIEEMVNRFSMPNVEKFEKSHSMHKVINQLIMSTVVRGAASLELVLTEDLNDVAFIAPVDPLTVEFKLEEGRFIPYQDNGKVRLDIPTFFYEGLDERIDDPYGRSPFTAALSMVMFQLQILNDIKSVVHNQGYPRLDIKIVEEVLLKRMPIGIRNNEKEKQAWLNERLTEIISMYNDLEPDDTFVHYDSVEIDMVGGSSGGSALIDPQKLMTVIDNLVMAGLKTLSTILGRRSTGNTESFAKMEIKLYMQGIKAIQEVVSDILSRALTLALNIKGKQGVVKVEFLPVEIRTELEQEQFRQIKYLNLITARDQGWITQDEASESAVGHVAVSEPDWEHIQPVKNKDGETPSGTTDTNPNAGGSTDSATGN